MTSIESKLSENRFIDTSTVRKNKIVTEKLYYHKNLPVFSMIEFNIAYSCTRNCEFCPVSDKTFYKKRNEYLPFELFYKIVRELKEINYRGSILFSGFSEPLLHKDLEQFIHKAKQTLFDIRFEIVTNGDLITAEKLKSLFKSGLDTLIISLYDGPHQIDFFSNLREKCNLSENQIVLRRRYYENGNYGMTLSNRAGLIDSNKYRDKNEEKITKLPYKNPCYYPFYMIFVDLNGDVLLCPHDWAKKKILGNLQKDSLWNIWSGEQLNYLRKKLIKSDRSFSPCKYCDVLGTVIGYEHFLKWKDFYDNQ
jgi:radical SAM protein with 4Fe4S-binding SPASM domain